MVIIISVIALFVTIIRTIIIYFAVVFSIRIMGKRQIGDLQPGELVITILISEIAAIPIQDLSQPILSGVFAILTLVFLEILISVLAMKIYPLRRFFYGTSAVVIKDGVIDQEKLKSLRITAPDLLEVLRNREIFDIRKVAIAILETNGQLSVMLKSEYQNATANDLKGIKTPPELPNIVVSDGTIIKDELIAANYTKKQVLNTLKKENIKLKEVFMMISDDKQNYSIIKKEK